MKMNGQHHAPTAFQLRNINGTNSIGSSVGPRVGLGISGKRKMCLLYWDLNTILGRVQVVPSSTHRSFFLHNKTEKYIENFSALNLMRN